MGQNLLLLPQLTFALLVFLPVFLRLRWDLSARLSNLGETPIFYFPELALPNVAGAVLPVFSDDVLGSGPVDADEAGGPVNAQLLFGD